jgi:hypothetical protein
MLKELLIEQYAHCGECLREKPDDIAPVDYAKYSIGITKDKSYVQVWCEHHQGEVALLQLATPLDITNSCNCNHCE